MLRFLGLDIPHGGEAVDNPTIDRPVGRLVGDHVDVKHVDVKHVDDIQFVKHNIILLMLNMLMWKMLMALLSECSETSGPDTSDKNYYSNLKLLCRMFEQREN